MLDKLRTKEADLLDLLSLYLSTYEKLAEADKEIVRVTLRLILTNKFGEDQVWKAYGDKK